MYPLKISLPFFLTLLTAFASIFPFSSSFSSFFVRGDRDTLTHASHEPRWKPLHHRSQYIAYKGEAKEIEVIKSPLPWEYLKEENVPQNFDWSR